MARLWILSEHVERGDVVHKAVTHAEARRMFKLLEESPNFDHVAIVRDVTEEILHGAQG